MSTPPPCPPPDYESTPLARSEYIAAMVHLYRGELYRANSWRLRLDNTTNWAVLTTAGLLSLSFGDRHGSHWVLLLGFPVIAVFHGFEARRFRLFDIWRRRVRTMEENFYGPILRRDPASPDQSWGSLYAEDLFVPRFKISRVAALRARFVRNYWAIYLVLLLAWILRILTVPVDGAERPGILGRLETGSLAWWAPMIFLGLFAGACVWLYAQSSSTHVGGRALFGERGGGDGHENLDLMDV